MTTRNITKSLAGMEDLAQGVGVEQQARGDSIVNIGRIDIPYSVSSIEQMSALDVTKFTKARVYSGATVANDYIYDPLATEGEPSLGVGKWVIDVNSLAGKVRAIASVSALASAALVEGQSVELIGYHDGTTVGGGSGVIKTAIHNGGAAISLTRARPPIWGDNTGGAMDDWFADSGVDELCFVLSSDEISEKSFGALDDETLDSSLSIQAYSTFIKSTNKTSIRIEGVYLINSPVNLDGLSLDATGSKILAGVDISDYVFTGVGRTAHGGRYELKAGITALHYPSAFYQRRVYDIYYKRGILVSCEDIVVGSSIEDIDGLENDLLIHSRSTGVSTTLTTNNIYLNYHKQFIKFNGQLFGHYGDSVILENGLGKQFDITGAYQYVQISNLWAESNAVGRIMDFDTGVGGQFQFINNSNLRFVSTAGGSVINTTTWTNRGVYSNGKEIRLGDAVSPVTYKLSDNGFKTDDAWGYGTKKDFEVILADASGTNTQEGSNYKIKTGRGSNGQPNGKVIISDGINESSLGVGSSGLVIPENTVMETSGIIRKEFSGSLTASGVFETVFSFGSSRHVARIFATVGTLDRTSLLFCGTSVSATLYSDTGTISSNIQLSGNNLQLRAGFNGYGLPYRLSVEYKEV